MTGVNAKPQTTKRTGLFRRRIAFLIMLLVAFVTIGGGVVYSFRSDGTSQIITCKPTVGEFVVDIVERGDVESSANVELRCEISSADGVRILELVPEGTIVKPGDVVIQLDDSTIKKDLTAQRITLNTVEAAYSKAKNEFDAAVIARQEYELGTFVQEEQKLESELFVAEENARRATNYHEHSRKLAARGYITDTQLESDRFAVEKYGKERDAATTKLRVIRDYTKPKTLKKHESDIKTAEAAAASEKSKYDIEVEKLANLESQLEKCVIKATTTGQVVYHNPNRWRDDDYTVRKGNKARERQVIVKLPDISQMQVKTKIAESRVDRVKPGMEAVIRVEALRGSELKGIVKTISAFASDENWFNPNMKEYDAIITITEPPPTLKPGMSSQVSIRVETQTEVMQIPVQCVVERNAKHYGIVRDTSGQLVLRELLIGSTNEKFIIVKDGIGPKEDVVMNPRVHLARLGLKDADSASGTKPTDSSKPSIPATPVAGTTGTRGAT